MGRVDPQYWRVDRVDSAELRRVPEADLADEELHAPLEGALGPFLVLGAKHPEKSEALRNKIQTLDHQTKASLNDLEKREVTIQGSVEIAPEKVEAKTEAALTALRRATQEDENGEVDNGEGLLLSLKLFCLKMDALGFWRFITSQFLLSG
jgi:hypothetical protein